MNLKWYEILPYYIGEWFLKYFGTGTKETSDVQSKDFGTLVGSPGSPLVPIIETIKEEKDPETLEVDILLEQLFENIDTRNINLNLNSSEGEIHIYSADIIIARNIFNLITEKFKKFGTDVNSYKYIKFNIPTVALDYFKNSKYNSNSDISFHLGNLFLSESDLYLKFIQISFEEGDAPFNDKNYHYIKFRRLEYPHKSFREYYHVCDWQIGDECKINNYKRIDYPDYPEMDKLILEAFDDEKRLFYFKIITYDTNFVEKETGYLCYPYSNNNINSFMINETYLERRRKNRQDELKAEVERLKSLPQNNNCKDL